MVNGHNYLAGLINQPWEEQSCQLVVWDPLDRTHRALRTRLNRPGVRDIPCQVTEVDQGAIAVTVGEHTHILELSYAEARGLLRVPAILTSCREFYVKTRCCLTLASFRCNIRWRLRCAVATPRSSR